MNRGIKALQASALPLGHVAVPVLSIYTKRARTSWLEISKMNWSGRRDSHVFAAQIHSSRSRSSLNAPNRRIHPSRVRIVQIQTSWSGRRDSNPRHPPWQGGALPAELLPRAENYISEYRLCVQVSLVAIFLACKFAGEKQLKLSIVSIAIISLARNRKNSYYGGNSTV